MSIYLDTSVLIPTLVEEEISDAVSAYLIATEEELLVSEFAAAEVASALSRLVRMHLLATGDALARFADFEAWRAAAASPVDIHPADARLTYAFVRRFDLMLRAPDALHLAIAARLDAALVTLDRRLERAANQLGIGVELLRTK
ncbi:MAG: type II toxin-antitoxin system VapC family toxin [Stellaceae bacterium]